MPWKIQHGGEDCPFEVVKEDTGERVACHNTEEEAKKHMAALYANEPSARSRRGGVVEFRSAAVDAVDHPQRIITVKAVPYNEPTIIPVRGEEWSETVLMGAFDGFETSLRSFRVNRDHDSRRVVGKVIRHYPDRKDGLIVDAHISKTLLGNETLELAADGVLGGSVGMVVRTGDQEVDRRARTRIIHKAYLDHLALVPEPAYPTAEVIGVRSNSDGEEALPPGYNTPLLDEFLRDPIFAWTRSRLGGDVDLRASDGDSKKPYGDVTYADPGYKEDGQKRYPINTEAHARAALSYFSMPKNHEGYTSEQISSIMGRIKAACKRFGIEVAAEK